MPNWTCGRVAGILQAPLCGAPEIPVQGCVLDSRLACGGEIFFALPGEKVDGHAFITKAWIQGAVLAVAQRERVLDYPEIFPVPQGKALVLVESPQAALQVLAGAWRQELGAKVIGITGSNGKTTTKDMVHAVLAQKFRVYKNKANHNNELGLPLTILNAPADTEMLVLEMGMRGLGEIAALCAIARPETGVITNIGTTHMELLGSQERIAQAKWEIAAALPPGGVMILNAEDEWSVRKARENPDQAVRFYGIEGTYAEPDILGSDLTAVGDLGTKFQVRSNHEPIMANNDFGVTRAVRGTPAGGENRRGQTLEAPGAPEASLILTSDFGLRTSVCSEAILPLPGRHNVLDALAALTVGAVYGVPPAAGCRALAQLQLSGMRLEVVPGINESVLISDVYNANPVSMQASLDILKERSGQYQTLAILGEMYELGELSRQGHRQVGEAVARLRINGLITVGEMAADIAQGAIEAGYPGKRVFVTATRKQAVEAAANILQGSARPIWVLIKGSRGMKMEEITAQLRGSMHEARGSSI